MATIRARASRQPKMALLETSSERSCFNRKLITAQRTISKNALISIISSISLAVSTDILKSFLSIGVVANSRAPANRIG